MPCRLPLDPALFLSCCVSIDLEVDPKSTRLFAIGAVWGPAVFSHRGGGLESALDRLESFCAGAEHLVGHNILRHDLPHLVANRARLAALGAAPVDTLWLNPLAFPRSPYHHLVKHYQDGRLQVGHVNDPAQDARLALQVLADQIAAFARLGAETPDTLTAYHHLTTLAEASSGFDALFRTLRGSAPGATAAHAAIRRLLAGRTCVHRLEQTLGNLSDPRNGWPMAYALAWISVAGGDSVMPPWVRMQFPQAGRLVRHLRDTNCGEPSCGWCAEKNNPKAALKRWFGFSAFRPQPMDDMGRPLQERIVAEGMVGKSVLGILPTGTGKSVCYQVGIPFAHLPPRDGDSPSAVRADDGVIWRWADGHGLLGQPVEEHAAGLGSAAVEAEGEFVEVVVEMLVLDAALQRSHEPPLEQRGDLVDARHDDVSRIGAGADDGDRMPVASRRQTGIAAPAIGLDGRAGFHGAAHEGQQAVGRDVGDSAQSDPAEAAAVLFCRHRDDGLAGGFPTLLAFLRGADIGLVHLHLAMQAVATGTDHRPPQLVQPGPRRLVAAQPQHTLQAQGAHPILLAGDEPHRQEPQPQGLARPFEDRAGRQRHLPAAGATAQQPARHFRRLLHRSAGRAGEAVRPAQPSDVGPARRFAAEPRLELLKRPGVINSWLGAARIRHASILSLGGRCGKGIPTCYQILALSRFEKTGALTVVISPLVALMADQVQGLMRAGISSAVTVNGMLSLPERHDALEKVRMGGCGNAQTATSWGAPKARMTRSV